MSQNATEAEFEIYEIIEQNGMQRLLARSSERQEVAIVPEQPIANIGREETHRFRGIWKRSGVPGIPNEFHLSGKQPEKGRLVHLLEDGATVASFGAGTSGNDRPALVAASYAGRAFEIKAGGKEGEMRLAPLAAGSCPTIRWAAGLIKGLTGNTTVMVLNPRAYTPALYRLYPEHPGDVGRGYMDPVDDAYDLLYRMSPTGWSGFINPGIAGAAADGAPCATWPAEEETMLRPRRRRIVIPYNPNESWECLYQAMTGLHANYHPCRRDHMLNATERDMLATAHELAHAIEGEFGMYALNTDTEHGYAEALSMDEEQATHRAEFEADAWTHSHECFADAFAMLAVTQKLGDDRAARIWADMRMAGGWKSDRVHMTGAACKATLAEIRKLKGQGKLASMSPAEMAQTAFRIAEEHAFSTDQMIALADTRKHIIDKAGIELTRWQQNTMPAYEAIRAAVQNGSVADPFVAGVFGNAIAAIERVSWRPEVMFTSPELQAEMLAAHEDDLKDTRAAIGDGLDSLGLLAFNQRLRHEPLAVGEEAAKAGRRPQHGYGAAIEAVASKLAQPKWQRIQSIITDEIAPRKDGTAQQAEITPNPISLIYNTRPPSELAPYYAMPMADRLNALENCLRSLPEQQPAHPSYAQQMHYDKLALIAHAIRCDLTGYEQLESAPQSAHDALTSFVASRACPKTARTSNQQVQALKDILPQFRKALDGPDTILSM